MRAESIWKRWLAGVLIVGLAVTGPGVGFAGGAPRSGSIDDRLRALEAEIEQLKRERAQAAEEKPVGESEVKNIVDDAFKKQKVLAGWQDGFFLQSPGGDFKLKLRGYLQADGRFFASDDGDTGNATFTMRRVRPIFEGTVYKYFDFRIMPDFGGGNTVLQDAYGDIRYFSFASLRAGKFKPPVSLERLQSGAELTFIERSILQNLVPNRDVGVQLYGDLLESSLGYQVGIFNGVIDTESGRDVDLTDDKDFAGRIFTVPFKTTDIDPLKGLGFGIAGTYGHQNGESLAGLAYKTAGRSNYFTYNADAKVVSRGAHWRVVPQLYYYFGPFGLMGEYAVSKQKIEGTAGGAARADYDAHGWFLQASWVLTGEENTYKSVTPINNFDPRQGRWGAFEIAARVANTEIDNDPFETKVTTFTLSKGTTNAWAYTAGLNWYLNKNFKFQFNYERTDFAGRPSFGSKKLDHEDALLTRFQVSF
jgi:phosphate-selective porin OprO and OprP